MIECIGDKFGRLVEVGLALYVTTLHVVQISSLVKLLQQLLFPLSLLFDDLTTAEKGFVLPSLDRSAVFRVCCRVAVWQRVLLFGLAFKARVLTCHLDIAIKDLHLARLRCIAILADLSIIDMVLVDFDRWLLSRVIIVID